MKTKLPPLPKTGERRLLKLIAFLEVLPDEQFDFRRIVTARKKGCGTVCCAMGWTPALFPKLVQWDKKPIVWASDGLVKKYPNGWEGHAKKLFGEEINVYLFLPNRQDEIHHELPLCGYDATPKQVAKMLKKYLALTKEAA